MKKQIAGAIMSGALLIGCDTNLGKNSEAPAASVEIGEPANTIRELTPLQRELQAFPGLDTAYPQEFIKDIEDAQAALKTIKNARQLFAEKYAADPTDNEVKLGHNRVFTEFKDARRELNELYFSDLGDLVRLRSTDFARDRHPETFNRLLNDFKQKYGVALRDPVTLDLSWSSSYTDNDRTVAVTTEYFNASSADNRYLDLPYRHVTVTIDQADYIKDGSVSSTELDIIRFRNTLAAAEQMIWKSWGIEYDNIPAEIAPDFPRLMIGTIATESFCKDPNFSNKWYCVYS